MAVVVMETAIKKKKKNRNFQAKFCNHDYVHTIKYKSVLQNIFKNMLEEN